MKKRTKNNLAQMAALLPELDAEHQRGILGGTAVPVTSPDYPEMIPVSTVVASTVVLCATPESTFLPTTTAFVPTPTTSSVVTSIPVPTITVFESPLVSQTSLSFSVTAIVASETTTDKTTYSWEKMESMLNNGSWYGGMVDDIGYVGEQTTIFSPSNFGTGTYCTYSEYMRSIETNYVDHLLNTATGYIPIFGGVSEYGIGAINNVLQKLSGDLLEAGYVADSPIYTDIYQNFRDQSFEYRVWDARTGELVSSRYVNSMGYYKK